MYVGNRYPGDGFTRLVKALRPWLKPDSAGLQEVGEHPGNLESVRGYNLFMKRGPETERFHRSNAILLKKGLTFLGFEFIKAADGAGTPVTPPRSIIVVRYKKRGRKIAHINTHFHVVPEEDLARMSEHEYGKAARQYRDHAILLNKTALGLMRAGYFVVVTADANTRPRAGVPDWKYSVYNYLPKAGMKIVRNIVDLVGYDSRMKLTGHKIIHSGVTGGDGHSAIAVKLSVR